eukprot:7320654-Lingulodinium_polyedra.AAC.1
MLYAKHNTFACVCVCARARNDNTVAMLVQAILVQAVLVQGQRGSTPVSYTHLRAHETRSNL